MCLFHHRQKKDHGDLRVWSIKRSIIESDSVSKMQIQGIWEVDLYLEIKNKMFFQEKEDLLFLKKIFFNVVRRIRKDVFLK